MTPSISSVYDALVAHVATEAFADAVAPVRASFVRRVGPFSPTDPWFEERSAALWDRVLTDPAVLEQLAAAPTPAGFGRDHVAALAALGRAQRGLFEVHAAREGVDLVCVASGAAFRLAPADEAARGLATGSGGSRDGDDVAPGLIDGRVVPTAEGVAVLPGMLIHPAEAHEPILAVIDRARSLAMPEDDLLDSLLAMRHRHGALSRMKAKQVYRIEALGTPTHAS
jgi:hypothetical protein